MWQNIQDFQRRKPETFCFGNFAVWRSSAHSGYLEKFAEIRKLAQQQYMWQNIQDFQRRKPQQFCFAIFAPLSGYLEKFAENPKTGPATMDLAKHTGFPTTKTQTILFRQFCSCGAPWPTQGT